ncbi:MAG: 5'/3'-nucleotidase SurE [Deltaproteobacteria bacterium]|nr:5'/3'-nucleotidase SurE [Deltaproteobacteria bacterium]MBN2673454.1 5'/3'-nucleotidase SurE [Deltaproteobacteria bacterium]
MLRILLTNDDGVDAPGILALEESLRQHTEVECWVVAPDSQRSACSHSMSLGTPVTVEQRGVRHYAHGGVVADGVYWALVHLMAAQPPHLVVSGINRGANLAEDVIYSGTVAGAREAALRNVHGLAVSLVDGDDFSLAAKSAAEVAVSLARNSETAPLLLNLNYPVGEFSGPYFCRLGTKPYEPLVRCVSPAKKEKSYLLGGPPVANIPREPGTDVALIDEGKASITPLLINQTAEQSLTKKAFSFLDK